MVETDQNPMEIERSFCLFLSFWYFVQNIGIYVFLMWYGKSTLVTDKNCEYFDEKNDLLQNKKIIMSENNENT